MTPQEQQAKARFWGNHIGCKYQYINPDFPQMTPAVFTNCGLIKYDSNYRVRNENGFNKQAFEDCKLILRPLASITDEEAIECAVLALDDEIDRGKMDVQRFYPFDDPLKTVIRVNFNDPNCAVHLARINYEYILDLQGENNVYNFPFERVLDYLRSKSFALPSMGIDPVSENWAVLETANQPKG